ncbi:PH domain-containing protein [Rubrobacter xylanophilus]|uniref:PH domain-containing protein n=1 Tax=Rubrobacter xylanophilus TaxID=49319 RepID=UPI00155AC588|nr:PH domain-containing protein [Rubrobacter xylanophilus]
MQRRVGAPITEAAAQRNTIVRVYEDRVELIGGWMGERVEKILHRDIADVRIQGLVNCTLQISSSSGRLYRLSRMALPDARAVKEAIERQKQKAGLYEP